MRRFWLWAVGGFPVAFIVLVLWPPLLVPAAVGLLLVPSGSAPERLGLLQSIAAVLLLVAALNVSDGLDPLPWFLGGTLLAILGGLRYRLVARVQQPPAQ